MDRLWAGWRMRYIEGHDPESECLFCACASTGDDREALVLERGRRCYVMMNRYPYTSGHVMVVPSRHVARLAELDAEERDELMALLARAERALAEAYRAQGFNMGVNLGMAAGAGIPQHLHAHLVPRWSGDTNFMSAVAETRVLPEALDRTYERLRAAFAALGPVSATGGA
ncbi:MAG: HIT domain-containing protein [Candidatus Eiseniibacteriota bacterium]